MDFRLKISASQRPIMQVISEEGSQYRPNALEAVRKYMRQEFVKEMARKAS